jgi:type II secretory pathway component PulF
LLEVKNAVQGGDDLSQALAAHKNIFPGYFIFMIRAGEMSGRLKVVLKRLCELIEKQEETMSKIRMSMVYPALIFFIGFLTIFIILTFVIPRMAVMFDDLDQQLPMVTQILINTGHFLSVFWWLPGCAIIGLFLWIRKRRKTPGGKLFFDRLILRIPYWGHFLKIQEMERLARTMGTMLESGVDVPIALESAQGVINNEVIKIEFKRISQAVVQGSSLAAAFQTSPMFPANVIAMIGVGEESGRIENGFLKWAETFERESERTVKTVTTLIEPVMILVIGGVVGFMVIAMLLPIFRMNLIIN